MKNKKKRGSDVERELLKIFESMGGCGIRTAGSGSYGGKPDLLISFEGRIYAIEVKYTTTGKVSLRKDQVDSLIKFAEAFGAIPVLAIKIKRKGWWFINPRKLPKYYLKEEDIKELGYRFKQAKIVDYTSKNL